jgi:hypothetical protein
MIVMICYDFFRGIRTKKDPGFHGLIISSTIFKDMIGLAEATPKIQRNYHLHFPL